MCGIAGIYSREPVPREMVGRMLDAIRYRGPDHQEVKQYRGIPGGYLTVGQDRLAILDLSPAANQPFDADDRGSSFTFNGEIYNFPELKKELAALGHQFHTTSDTEVALRCLDLWGEGALNRLWGMFAGAYFQKSDGSLLLFRDRLGQKPLYVYPRGGRLYFASEPKAILAVLSHIPEPDDEALARYFYLGYVPNDHCVFRGMFKVAAGHCLHVGPNLERRSRRWYHPERELMYSAESLRRTFLDAVAKRMISDVPLAAFLSGGLDSSLVVAAMSRQSSRPVNTFSVRFDGPQVLDESKYARMVASHCHTDHSEIALDTHRLKDSINIVLAHFDEPFGDASAVPTFLVSRAARRQFTVALTGDGADEVFAGYRKYQGEYYLRKLGPYFLRKHLWRPLSRLLPTGRTHALLELNRKLRRLLRGDHASPAARHVNWLYMSPIDGEPLLGPRLREHGPMTVRDALLRQLPSDATLNDCLRFDQNLVLQDDMFVKIDRMGMKASLELRSPFVDHRLVALANRLPPERKLAGTARKKILVESLGRLLPREILTRPKTGFEMPLGAWLRDDLKTWAANRLFEFCDTSAWVNREGLRNAWKVHCSGKLDCTETLWYHIVFATWLKGVHG